MRVVFCGNPKFAIPTLRELISSSHDVVSVVTSPDQPQGRGRKLAPMPVKAFAELHRLHVVSPESLRDDPEFLKELTELRPDVLVVVAFRILPRAMFAMPQWRAERASKVAAKVPGARANTMDTPARRRQKPV